MGTNTVTFPGGKHCELRATKAVVLSTSRDSQTRISGGGGGGRLIAGGGTLNDIKIQSHVIEHFRIWVKYLHNDQEQEIDVGNSGFTCREGHQLVVVEARSKKTAGRYEIIGMRNESTGTARFVPDAMTIMWTLGLIKPLLQIGPLELILLWGASWLLLIADLVYLVPLLPVLGSMPAVALTFFLFGLPVAAVIVFLKINDLLRRRWFRAAALVEDKLKDALSAAVG